jgi:transcriptional regulator with XRE-family HTH domain
MRGAQLTLREIMSRKLSHYLRHERKRASLSQRDIAILLGDLTVSKVSRYERRRRVPLLVTALAYEVILGKPVSELFGGMYGSIREEIAERAKTLLGDGTKAANVHLKAARKRSIEAVLLRQ